MRGFGKRWMMHAKPTCLPNSHQAPVLQGALAESALARLGRGDPAHDEAAARASQALVGGHGCVAIALAQFSLARAAPRFAAACGVPALAAVDSAVRLLRLLLV